MKRLAYLILAFMLASCQSNENRIQASDTVGILNTVFTSRPFFETLLRGVDTVYVLKPKIYNSSWPGRVNQVFIKYIDDTPAVRVPNNTIPVKDVRLRYNFPRFVIEGDSAKIVLYNFNFVTGMHYSLHKENDGWRIVKSYVVMQ